MKDMHEEKKEDKITKLLDAYLEKRGKVINYVPSQLETYTIEDGMNIYYINDEKTGRRTNMLFMEATDRSGKTVGMTIENSFFRKPILTFQRMRVIHNLKHEIKEIREAKVKVPLDNKERARKNLSVIIRQTSQSIGKFIGKKVTSVLGAFVGSWFGGPIGAAVGGAAGSFASTAVVTATTKVSKHFEPKVQWTAPPVETVRDQINAAICSSLDTTNQHSRASGKEHQTILSSNSWFSIFRTKSHGAQTMFKCLQLVEAESREIPTI